MYREITDEIAISKLKELIAIREKEIEKLPLFMTDEILEKKMEINDYRVQIQKLQKGGAE